MDYKNRFELAGWLLFVVCAVLFIISSWQSQDMLLLIGSILFFLACILFIIPLVSHKAD